MKTLMFDNVRRAYERGRNVLDGVSFSVGPGEVVGLLGRNGAGKTTLIRIAMGMIEAQEGSVRVFGMEPQNQPLEVKRRLGYVSEEQILPPFLRVGEIVDLHRDLFPTWDARIADRLSSNFGLPRSAKIANLSKGQARQVALMCAVAHAPELLLLDEPAGGLDPVARREFLETSINVLNDTGTAILFSSHYMTDVERLAERVVLLHDRRVLIDSSLDDLREAHCVALVPHGAGATVGQLVRTGKCLGARERTDAIHAVFNLAPNEASALIKRDFGIGNARCVTVPLEEMFIELVGGQL
jgi:ABC-2 type transport system ATP-binding protein